MWQNTHNLYIFELLKHFFQIWHKRNHPVFFYHQGVQYQRGLFEKQNIKFLLIFNTKHITEVWNIHLISFTGKPRPRSPRDWDLGGDPKMILSATFVDLAKNKNCDELTNKRNFCLNSNHYATYKCSRKIETF